MKHFRPPERVDIVEWIETHARLYDGSRVRLYPYQREIVRAMVDPSVRQVTLMKSARVGYTQLVSAMLAYWAAHDPCHVMVVQPTVEDAEDYSKDVVESLVDWPIVAGLVRDVVSKVKKAADTIKRKVFPGGSLKIVGSNSPRAFRRVDVDKMLADERDAYPAKAGKEGEHTGLMKRRLMQSTAPLLVQGSTPTIKGHSPTEADFMAGSQEWFNVPCPCCGHEQVLVWGDANPDSPGMKWPKGEPENAYYQCAGEARCRIERDEISPDGRTSNLEWMLEHGRYIAANPEALKRGHRSFHIWTAYCPLPGAAWGTLASEFVEAKGNPLKMIVFVNTVLGETFAMRGEAPPWRSLYDRREEWTPGMVPHGALFLTVGIDVQKDRVEAYVWGWGRGRSSYLVERKVCMGSPWAKGSDGPWAELAEFLSKSWGHETSGVVMKPVRVCIDSGFATTEVAAFCRLYPKGWMMPVKGASTMSAPPLSPPKPIDLVVNGRQKRRALKVWLVGDHCLKQELYGLLTLQPPTDEEREAGVRHPPGYVHLPVHEADAEVCKQLVGEEWDQEHGRWKEVYAHEALDCWKYARAGAISVGIEKMTDSDWLALEAQIGVGPDADPHQKQPQAAPPPEPKPEPLRLPEQKAASSPARRPSPSRGHSWLGRR